MLLFIKGINMGIAKPGTHPSELAASRADYGRWLQMIREAGFNAIRLYTLHYPHFYEVPDSFSLANPQHPVLFFQGVWLEEEVPGYDEDLYSLTAYFDREIEENVDCVHGNRTVPRRWVKPTVPIGQMPHVGCWAISSAVKYTRLRCCTQKKNTWVILLMRDAFSPLKAPEPLKPGW